MTKLKTEEYVAEVMPDGHLSLPEKIAERLNLRFYNRVRVIIKKTDDSFILSDKAKRKALALKKFISDMGPDDLSEKFREKYK
jgi:hypothetical protein